MSLKPFSVMFEIKYSFTSVVAPKLIEPDRFVKEITADVIASDLDSNSTTSEVLVGRLGFSILRLNAAINNNVAIEDVFDANDDLLKLGSVIYEEGYKKLNYRFLSVFPNADPFNDIFYLDYAFLVKEVRHNRLLPACIFQFMQDFDSDSSFIFCKPEPFQFFEGFKNKVSFCKDLAVGSYSSNMTNAFNCLVKYFCSFGFKEIPLTETVVLSSEDIEPDALKADLPFDFQLPISFFDKK